MMNKNLLLLIVIAISMSLFSCSEENTINTDSTGELVIGYKINSQEKTSHDYSTPAALVVSIKNSAGESIYHQLRIELYNMNGYLITPPIALMVGEYILEEFFVLDDSNNVLYATPKEGSELANLVNNPLPIEFIILEDEVNKLVPDVVSSINCTPDDFGYATFSFNIVKTLNFLTGIFIYNYETNNFDLTNANLTIENDGNILYNKDVDAITNQIYVNSSYEKYLIKVTKPGYQTYIEEFLKDSLEQHANDPLIIILKEGQNEIILQPGSEGEDAVIWSCLPNTSNPDSEDFQAMAWTWNSLSLGAGTRRSLIRFDLSQIPEGATILDAELSLYFNPNHPESPTGHSNLSGSNQSVLEKITSDWEESLVTWNNQPSTTSEHSVTLEQSTNYNQNYLDMDVTSMLQQMVNEPGNNFGFMLKLSTESYYRCLLFASSDHQDSEIRPKLTIKYEL